MLWMRWAIQPCRQAKEPACMSGSAPLHCSHLISHQLCNCYAFSVLQNQIWIDLEIKTSLQIIVCEATVREVWRRCVQWRRTGWCSSACIWFLRQLAAWRLLEQQHHPSQLLAKVTSHWASQLCSQREGTGIASLWEGSKISSWPWLHKAPGSFISLEMLHK